MSGIARVVYADKMTFFENNSHCDAAASISVDKNEDVSLWSRFYKHVYTARLFRVRGNYKASEREEIQFPRNKTCASSKTDNVLVDNKFIQTNISFKNKTYKRFNGASFKRIEPSAIRTNFIDSGNYIELPPYRDDGKIIIGNLKKNENFIRK